MDADPPMKTTLILLIFIGIQGVCWSGTSVPSPNIVSATPQIQVPYRLQSVAATLPFGSSILRITPLSSQEMQQTQGAFVVSAVLSTGAAAVAAIIGLVQSGAVSWAGEKVVTFVKAELKGFLPGADTPAKKAQAAKKTDAKKAAAADAAKKAEAAKPDPALVHLVKKAKDRAKTADKTVKIPDWKDKNQVEDFIKNLDAREAALDKVKRAAKDLEGDLPDGKRLLALTDLKFAGIETAKLKTHEETLQDFIKSHKGVKEDLTKKEGKLEKLLPALSTTPDLYEQGREGFIRGIYKAVGTSTDSLTHNTYRWFHQHGSVHHWDGSTPLADFLSTHPEYPFLATALTPRPAPGPGPVGLNQILARRDQTAKFFDQVKNDIHKQQALVQEIADWKTLLPAK